MEIRYIDNSENSLEGILAQYKAKRKESNDMQAAWLLANEWAEDERAEAQSRQSELFDEIMQIEDTAAEEGWEDELTKARSIPDAPRALLPANVVNTREEVKLSSLEVKPVSIADKLQQIREQKSSLGISNAGASRPTPRWGIAADEKIVHSSFGSGTSMDVNFSSLASVGSKVSANDLSGLRTPELPVGWRRDLNQMLWAGLAATLQIAGGFLLDRVLRGHSPVDITGSSKNYEDSIHCRILHELENES